MGVSPIMRIEGLFRRRQVGCRSPGKILIHFGRRRISVKRIVEMNAASKVALGNQCGGHHHHRTAAPHPAFGKIAGNIGVYDILDRLVEGVDPFDRRQTTKVRQLTFPVLRYPHAMFHAS